MDETYDNSSMDASEDFPSFIMPWWRQVAWTLLFAGTVVAGTVGNLLVIWIVLANKQMRTVTNYFLVNLSVADAMMSVLNVSFSFTYMLTSDWPFGNFYCKFSQFTSSLSLVASVFTLLAITVDRYIAIMSPRRAQLGQLATLGLTAGIWGSSVLISIPNLVFFTTLVIELPDGTFKYNLVFIVLTYFLPLIAMTYAYARVGVVLWGSRSLGQCTQQQLDDVQSKRRVVKMMIAVVVIFAVCWLPINVWFFVMSHHPDLGNYEHIHEIFLAIYWLAMSNSIYNPIIYCWMNSEFRRGFKQFFSCCGAFGPGGSARHRPSGTERTDPSVVVSSSTKNATSTTQMSMNSTHNNTMGSTA